MSGRVNAKVINIGKDAKNNTAMPIEYVVAKKLDAHTKEKTSNVDASENSEQSELIYSRSIPDFETLKNETIISHDSCDESYSVISSSSSDIISGITAETEGRALFGFEEKLMRLCDSMQCAKVEEITDIDDDSNHVDEEMVCMCISVAEKVDGVKASKSHDFSVATFDSKSHDFSRGTWDSRSTFESKSHDFRRDTWDSDTDEDSHSKDSAIVEKVKEDLLGEDEVHSLEPSKEVEPAYSISANEKKVLKPEEIGAWLTGGIQRTGNSMPVIYEYVEVGDVVEEESHQTPGESALLVSMDSSFEKVDEDKEKGEDFPGIEYTLSLVELNAVWDEIEGDGRDTDGIKVNKMHNMEPLNGAATLTNHEVDKSILERTDNLTESEDPPVDGIHVTDEIISVASVNRASSRPLFKDGDVFVAPALGKTLSIFKKHKVNAKLVAISKEKETFKAVEDALLESMDSIARNVNDEDDLYSESIEYAPNFHQKRDFDDSRALELAAATKTVDDNSAELPDIEYTLRFHEYDASTESNASAPIAVTKVNMNGIPLAGSQMKDPSPISCKCEMDADQTLPNQDAPIFTSQPDSHTVIPVVAGTADTCKTAGHKHRRALRRILKRHPVGAEGKSAEKTTKVIHDKGVVAKVNNKDVPLTKSKVTVDKSAEKAGSNAEKDPTSIHGKRQTDDGQVSRNRDVPCVVGQPESKNVLPLDAAMADSPRRPANHKYWRSLRGRSRRSSTVPAAKSAGNNTKASDDKSAVDPHAGEVPASLDAKSSEKGKSTDLVALKHSRPFAVVAAKSAERTTKATDETAVKPLVDEVPASLNDGSPKEQNSTDPVTPDRALSQQSTTGLIHVGSSPTSVVDAIFAKRVTDTKASTNKKANNEPEAETNTEKIPRKKSAANAQQPSGDASEPCKGFTDGKIEAKGEQVLTNEDAKNAKEPRHCTRGRSQSVTHWRRSLSFGRPRSEPATLLTHKMDNRCLLWFTARKEEATEAHDGGKQDEKEDVAVSRREKKISIMMRQTVRKKHAYEEFEDKEDDEIVEISSFGDDDFSDCSAFPQFTQE